MNFFKITIIALIGLTACTSPNEEKQKELKDTIQILTNKPKSTLQFEKANLKGIWWDANEIDAPTASFEIKETTIFYPDQEGKSEYKYKIKHDTMLVKYDGFESISIITKATKDTLILITDDREQVFIKRNN